MNKISLTASMRSNLLSLQNISGQVSSTQNKLATGKKVNSAIDNPSSYYTALSLNNRADDLNALLDSMGQAVSTIKATTTALESATEFLEQASAVANQALETTSDEEIAARVSSETELLEAVNSGKKGLIILEKDIVMSQNQSIELKEGQSLVGIGYLDRSKPQTKLSFNFNKNINEAIKTENNLIANIAIEYTTSTVQYSKVIGGTNLKMRNVDVSVNIDQAAGDILKVFEVDNIEVEGFNNVVYGGNDISKTYKIRGFENSDVSLKNDAVLNLAINDPLSTGATFNLYGKSTLNIKSGDSHLSVYANSINIYDQATLNASGNYGIWGTQLNILSAETNVNINTQSYEFWDGNFGNKAKLTMVSGSSLTTKSGTYKAKSDVAANSYSEINNLLANQTDFNASETVDTKNEYNKVFGDFETYIKQTKSSSEKVDSSQYTSILSQYDALIKDAGYKGVNLLQEQNLKVTFNENRSSLLEIMGRDASSQTLGLVTLEWNSKEDVEKSIEELTGAINEIRAMSSEFGNHYNIITTRQDFTENLVNVLTEGADKLTLADMNEESANMLALQTCQQLAINSLSLASQASQSILKLF